MIKKTLERIRAADLDASDLLALLGVAILAASAADIYKPAAGIIVGVYLLVVAAVKGR